MITMGYIESHRLSMPWNILRLVSTYGDSDWFATFLNQCTNKYGLLNPLYA